MNLFVISLCPKVAARSLCDQHVNKMILETVQILDGGTRPLLFDLYPQWSTLNCDIVKIPKSHRDNRIIHSVQSRQVWDWAYSHLCELLNEFEYRYGKPHAYHDYLGEISEREAMVWSRMNKQGFVLAMPDLYKVDTQRKVNRYQAVVSYRRYYAQEKMTYGAYNRPTTWIRRPPAWLIYQQQALGRALIADKNKFKFEDKTA